LADQQRSRAWGLNFDDVRALVLDLPGVEDGTSYGTPALKVRRKLLTRLTEDGRTVVVHVSFDEREMLIEADPATFYITDHYRPWPMMLARLDSVDPGTLKRLLVQAWRERASKTMLAAYEAQA
jgi:hypothetical protein